MQFVHVRSFVAMATQNSIISELPAYRGTTFLYIFSRSRMILEGVCVGEQIH
jgi:hypothetical protein